MTLWLARRVVQGVVDETTTIYIGRCDLGDDCRYMVEHRSDEVVEDALDGHRRRAHATTTARSEDVTRTGWIPSLDQPYAGSSWTAAAPAWTPSPTPREEP